MSSAPVFPDRLRLPLEFDPARLAADLATLSAGGWIAHFVTQNYDGDWSVIPLRGPAGARHPVRLMRLSPGSVIKEHRDHDLAFEDGTVNNWIQELFERALNAETGRAA